MISNEIYYCEVPNNSTDIKQISVEPDFHFDYQDNVTFVGITPFANIYKDNIQNVDDSYDYISDSNIYVLEVSKKIKYNKNNFNISGVMLNLNANFTSKNFDLLIYRISGNRTQMNVQCSFADVIEVNINYYYTLSCSSDYIFDGLLQTAIAFIDNDILIIYFDNFTESGIDINKDENRTIDTYRYRYEDTNKFTVILLSVLIPTVLLFCFIVFITIKRRSKKEKQNEEIYDSTNIKIAT